MATLNRNGVNLYFQAEGSGPAIFLTHGFGASSRMWDGQVEAFRDRYRIIVWDMRGHGDTDSPEDAALYSEPETVADMAAILDACGEESAVIGGLSLGGYMSLAFNLAHPERTRALMLFEHGPRLQQPEGPRGLEPVRHQAGGGVRGARARLPGGVGGGEGGAAPFGGGSREGGAGC